MMRTRTFLLPALLLGPAIVGSIVGARAQSNANIAAPSGWVPKSLAYVKPSNTTHDQQFGYSVAVSGDGNTLAVGSVNEGSGAKGINGNQADHSTEDAGAAYVYTLRNGAWAQQAYIKASNPHEGALFGNAVALSGDGNTLAVAAYLEDSATSGINGNQADHSLDSAGAVYVFTRTGANWTQQAYVKASNPGEGDQFGFSVALSGDGNTLAVGAIEEGSKATGVNGNQADDSGAGTGAGYVFKRTGTTWSQEAYVKPDVAGGLFGYGVGLSADGNTLAVGAENEEGNSGSVYAFVRTGATWSKQVRLRTINSEGGDSVGWSVGISADGNTIAAGAFDEDSLLTGVPPNDQGAHDAVRDTSSGAAYVFVRSGDTWAQQAWFKAINTRKNDQFGISIAVSGDGNTVAVGSHFGAGTGASKGVNGNPNDDSVSGSGSVYVYTRSGSTWTPAAYVKAPNARVSAEFGNSVSLSRDGKTLAVGSLRETSAAKGINGNEADTSAPEAGAAYVFC
jgi:FG-GAP repeat